MIRKLIVLLALVLSAAMMFHCASAGIVTAAQQKKQLDELISGGKEAEFNGAVDAFFAALDAKDAQAVRSLFAPAALDAQPDFDAQLERLMNVYPGETQVNQRRGAMAAGERSIEAGQASAFAYQAFPVIASGENFVCRFELMYENDADARQIGVRKVVLMNMDTAYALRLEIDGVAYPETDGIHLMLDYDACVELHFVEGRAEQVSLDGDTFSEADVRAAFADDKCETARDFVNIFGEPDGEEDRVSYRKMIYELEPAENEPRYLKLTIDAEDDKIENAVIVSDMYWKGSITN